MSLSFHSLRHRSKGAERHPHSSGGPIGRTVVRHCICGADDLATVRSQRHGACNRFQTAHRTNQDGNEGYFQNDRQILRHSGSLTTAERETVPSVSDGHRPPKTCVPQPPAHLPCKIESSPTNRASLTTLRARSLCDRADSLFSGASFPEASINPLKKGNDHAGFRRHPLTDRTGQSATISDGLTTMQQSQRARKGTRSPLPLDHQSRIADYQCLDSVPVGCANR